MGITTEAAERLWPFSPVFCTTKKALNSDQYEESGRCCVLVLPIPVSETRTRMYVNGHPTNGFVMDDFDHWYLWYRDPGCAAGDPVPTLRPLFFCTFFAKKAG